MAKIVIKASSATSEFSELEVGSVFHFEGYPYLKTTTSDSEPNAFNLQLLSSEDFNTFDEVSPYSSAVLILE